MDFFPQIRLQKNNSFYLKYGRNIITTNKLKVESCKNSEKKNAFRYLYFITIQKIPVSLSNIFTIAFGSGGLSQTTRYLHEFKRKIFKMNF